MAGATFVLFRFNRRHTSSIIYNTNNHRSTKCSKRIMVK